MNKLVKLAKKFRIAKQRQEIFAENTKGVIQNLKRNSQELKYIGSIFDKNEIISLVKRRLDEDSGKIFNSVSSSVIQELKAMSQDLGKEIVDVHEPLHSPIEKSFPHGNDFSEMLPRKKNRTALWRILRRKHSSDLGGRSLPNG